MTTGRCKYKVGFIGIGKMGLPMVSRIAAHGYPLHAYDFSEAAIKEFRSRVADARTRIAKQMDYPYNELARSMSAGEQIPSFSL